MRRRPARPAAVAGLLLAVAVAACRSETPPAAEAAPQRVEDATLGIALATVPSPLTVVSSGDGTIVLAPAAEGAEGRIVVAEGDTARNPNMVAAVEDHQAEIEARPGGVYQGQRELTFQLGPAFYSRGRWDEGGRTMEETKVWTLHPQKGDRLLHLTYVYPAGDDTATRLNDHLFAVLGEVEPLPAEGAGEADAGAEPAATTPES